MANFNWHHEYLLFSIEQHIYPNATDENRCYVLVIGIDICTNAYVIPVKLPLISTEKSRETSAVLTSMANPDLQVRAGGGGGRSSRPWDKGLARSPKTFFRPFGPNFGRKIRAGPPAPPLNPPLHIMLRNSLDSLWSLNFFPWHVYRYEQALCLWQYWPWSPSHL